jgi:hypothetical protein
MTLIQELEDLIKRTGSHKDRQLLEKLLKILRQRNAVLN